MENRFRNLTRPGIQIVLWMSVGLFTGCPEEVPNPFAQPTPVDPCDPAAEVYIDGKHFIERDYLDREGNIDYDRYYRALKPQNSPCDPLNKEESHTMPGSRPEKEDLRFITPNSSWSGR